MSSKGLSWDGPLTLILVCEDLLQSPGNSKVMNSYLETLEEIEDFLQNFSDPYREHAIAQPLPEPQLCMPLAAGGESSQQGSSQSQVTPLSKPMEMTCGSCDIPGMVLTQNSETPPGEDLERILQELDEVFDQNSPATSHEQVHATADYDNTHFIDIPELSFTDDLKICVAESKEAVIESTNVQEN